MQEPIVIIKSDGVTRELADDYIFNTWDRRTVFIPKGYTTDLASIPRIAWTLIGSPGHGKYAIPSIVHDWLCSTEHDWVDSAEIFLEAMEKFKVNPVKRVIIYWAVRSFKFFHQPQPGRAKYWKQYQQDRLDELEAFIPYVL